MEIAGVVIGAIGLVIGACTLFVILYDKKPRINTEYRLGEAPRTWLQEGRGSPTQTEALAIFRTLNTGKRAQLSDAYIELEDGRRVNPFAVGNPTMPIALESGVPLVFSVPLEGLARLLVNTYGCTGTTRVTLMILDGSGNLYPTPVEIPKIEAKAEGRELGWTK